MSKRGDSPNTRSGGQPVKMAFRAIVADPNGNREQRRAAKRLSKGKAQVGAVIVDHGEVRS